MKKIILGLCFLAIAATSTFVACKKDEVKVTETTTIKKSPLSNARITTGIITPEEMDKILALSSDSTFQALVRIRVAEYNNSILNAYALQTLLSTEMSSAKVPEYASLLGYSSTEEFIQTSNISKQLEAELEEVYQISAMQQDHMTEALYIVNPIFPNVSAAPPKPAHCESAYKSTIAGIVALQTAMHFGCAGADLTVIGGILCHAAVVTYGIAQTATADATYAACH